MLDVCLITDSFLCQGGRHSSECTLILTEGDSAKSLAVSGLGVIGRDRYGVFPLRGKILNVREATHKQVSTDAVIVQGAGLIFPGSSFPPPKKKEHVTATC